jgi:hypothetical protein
MPVIDGIHQALEFAPQVRRTAVMTLEQQGLEPPVKVLHRPIALRPMGRDEDRCDLQMQAQANHARQIACGLAPATKFAGIVELYLLRQPELLPGGDQKRQDLVHAPRTP